MVCCGNKDADLKASFPGRAAVIDELEDVIISTQGSSSRLMVYGPPSTGKTAIVRSALSAWGVRHAYADCIAASTPRALLHVLLPQLKTGCHRTREEGFVPPCECDSVAELLVLLPSLFRSKECNCSSAWIVLDNAERLAGSDLLAGLARAGDAVDVPLSLLLITRQPLSGALFATLSGSFPEPPQLEFTAYSSDQLAEIIMYRLLAKSDSASSDRALLRSFLTAFLPAFCRASCDLLEAEAAVTRLYPIYRAPLDAGRPLKPAQLYARASSAIQSAVAERSAKDVGPRESPFSCATGTQQLALQLPYVSKYLILAAYIASRNKPTVDRAIFDPGYRQRTKRGAQSHDRMVEAAQEASLKGPSPFSLERLLHIFFALYSAHESAEDAGTDGRSAQSMESEMLSADVLMALSSLVMLRMLSMAGEDVLDPGTLYHCSVEENVVQGIANNLSVCLSDYLKLA